ncbi:hypothetical protein OG598_05255 [Micromonospora sp. NBC_00330]|uniref:hypothetical protein n=1 Tax=Micromonospora sp. NBC_00330 TaxID=2903585 RepID=UPI002E2B1AE3|nr:hypothetical protein [Micromonospora sp. NBC_00330]
MISWRGGLWWVVVGPAAGVVLGAVDSIVNHVPVLLGEVGTARAERGGWSQAAEFASLILDAGWAWAAVAVLVGWLVSRTVRLAAGVLRGALAGGCTLISATIAYYGVDVIFDGDTWWDTATRYWLIASVCLGPLLGAVGALIRRSGPVGTLAVLLVPAGAALQMVLLPPPPESAMAWPVRLSVWAAAAVAAVLIARRTSDAGALARERPVKNNRS